MLFTDNLALGKPAWQRSPLLRQRYPSLTEAANAVDGDYTNLNASSGQCTISRNQQSKAEWRVDLRRLFSIHHIFLQYLTGNKNWGKCVFIACTYFYLTMHVNLILFCQNR